MSKPFKSAKMLGNDFYHCTTNSMNSCFRLCVACEYFFSLSLHLSTCLSSMKNDLFILIFCPIHNSCRVYMNIVHRARAAPRNPKQTISMFSPPPLSPSSHLSSAYLPACSLSLIYDIYMRERALALNCYDEPTVIHFTTHT